MKLQQNNFQIDVLRPRHLSDELVARWTSWHQSSAALSSPYFHPAFATAVSEVRDDVHVAVVTDESGPAAFFPFQRGRLGFGRPVGGRLSDFHGPITKPGCNIAAGEVISGCNLAAWDFSHLPCAFESFTPYHSKVEPSPYIDLTAGYDAFINDRKAAGSVTVKQTLRKTRKIERELGPLRLEEDVRDPELLRTMMGWKSKQYAATGVSDVFAFDWTRELLENLLAIDDDDFGGRLSVLYAGDALTAIHFGIYSQNVLHYWFPVYDPAYGKYSTGLILLLELARSAAEQGLVRIDLGKGDEEYKHSLGAGSIPVAVGSVEANRWMRSARNCWRNTRGWLKASPLGAPARATAKVLRPVRDWLSFK